MEWRFTTPFVKELAAEASLFRRQLDQKLRRSRFRSGEVVQNAQTATTHQTLLRFGLVIGCSTLFWQLSVSCV